MSEFKQGPWNRKRPNFKEEEHEDVKEVTNANGPALKWLEYGQIVYASIPWGPTVDDSKVRPVMYVEAQTRNEAIVRALYSKPRAGADLVTYRRRKSFLGSEVVIDRRNIYHVSTAIVEPEYNPLKAE